MTNTIASQLLSKRGSVDPWGRNNSAAQNEIDALRAKLNAEAREYWDNADWQKQVAVDLANMIDYQFTFTNLFSTWFRTMNVGEFDPNPTFAERRGLKVFMTSRGGRIEESQIRTERWEVVRDTMGFKVSDHIDKLRMNFATSMESMADLGYQRLEAEINRRVFNLLQAAIPSPSPNYVATAGLAQAEVNAALTAVRDAIKPNGEMPGPVTIIGRAAMIDKVSDFNLGFDPEGTQEIRNAGRLGLYRGANVISVNNFTDDEGISFIPANELWVFGGDVGRFVMFGGLNVTSWRNYDTDYQSFKARRDVGGLVWHPEQARRIVDSSVTA